ncbi:MAB_1171c family putative transporter [Streptosporangium sp. NPDC002607]
MTRSGASFRRLRRRCDEILSELPLPMPFDAGKLCDTVARRRSRTIRLEPMRSRRGVMGLWVAVDGADLIFYEQVTTPPHQEHIILHELSHLLCGHDVTDLSAAEQVRLLMPNLDSGMVHRVLSRGSYSGVEEREAELLASLIMQRSRRMFPLSGDVSAGIGQKLVAAGLAAALAYHVNKALLPAVAAFGDDHARPLGHALDAVLALVAFVCVPLGATMPAWGAFLRVPALLEWFHRYRVYTVLRPLWGDLYRANPQIALLRPPHRLAGLLPPRDLGLRLYRRVIEIRDGRMIVRHHLDPAVAAAARERAAAAGITGRKLDAVVEAATLSAALRAASGDEAPAGEPPRDTVPGGDDLAGDVAFLCDVARAYRRSRWAWRLSRLPGARRLRRLRQAGRRSAAGPPDDGGRATRRSTP